MAGVAMLIVETRGRLRLKEKLSCRRVYNGSLQSGATHLTAQTLNSVRDQAASSSEELARLHSLFAQRRPSRIARSVIGVFGYLVSISCLSILVRSLLLQ